MRYFVVVECSVVYVLCASSSSVSYRVGLPPHNAPFPGVLMKSIGAAFLRPDELPDVNYMRGMQCQIVINKIFWPEITNTIFVQICVYNSYTNSNTNLCCKTAR